MHRHLQVEYRPIESVTPNARNARTHSKKQIRQLANSIRAYDFINPVLVDEKGELVAGHARLLAAQELGLEMIPTIRIEHLSEIEKRAYMLADNKIALNAGWDDNLLRVELEFLANFDFDVELTGFSTTETDLVLGATVPFPEDDEIPPVPPV